MDDYRMQQAEKRRQERRKRAQRKNLIILVETLIIIVLIIALTVVSIKYAGVKNDSGVASENSNAGNSSILNSQNVSGVTSDEPTASNVTSSEGNTSSNTASTVVSIGATGTAADLDKWFMKLVNPDNKIDNAYVNSIERSKIKDKYIVSTTKDTCKYLDSRIVKYFEDMCKAAADDGITLISVSAYRSISYQSGLYDRRVERCQNEDGLSLEAAKKKAATIVAVPGTSEHHLGLAIDINSVETSFENTKAFRWLQEHAEEYGFILRYPKEKQNITKIIYEPWHYRFVGVEHAKAMNDLGMCMEEYIEHLSKS